MNHEQKTVLDLGCGPGALSIPMIGDGRSVYGLDLSPKMAGQASKLAMENCPSSLFLFSVGDAAELPYHISQRLSIKS
jgi:2-polyprenyl-3-methyl-5-hydroxy-6-metoxy-1,4-benzoquinol methylase